jgi:hypothetical protein
VVSIHRLACFRRALSQLSYTTMGPAPGLEPGSTGLQSQRPSRWAQPAFPPSRSGCVVWKWPFIDLYESQRGCSGVLRRQHRGRVRNVVAGGACPLFGNYEFQPIAFHMGTSFQVVREEGVEPSSQGPKPCVLPLDDSRADRWRGQWVPPPLLVGGSHACICQHLDPEEQ